MKINGNVNIMGIKEIIFRNKHKEHGCFTIIVRYQKEEHSDNSRWIRISHDNVLFCRDNVKIVTTIKSLAHNPYVNLTFNDGTMYIDFEPGYIFGGE